MNRYGILFSIICLTLLSSRAQASFFLGLPIATEMRGEESVSYLGVQFGTYDLSGELGLRGTLRVLPPLGGTPAFQFAGDLLYTRGEEMVLYLGGGAGYAVRDASEALFIGGTLGLDIDTESLISVFFEAQPRYTLTTRTVGLYLSGGLNVHFRE